MVSMAQVNAKILIRYFEVEISVRGQHFAGPGLCHQFAVHTLVLDFSYAATHQASMSIFGMISSCLLHPTQDPIPPSPADNYNHR